MNIDEQKINEVAQASRASQGKKELLELLRQVSFIYPETIVEIGAWRGYSLENWCKAFPGSTVVGIENDYETFQLLQTFVLEELTWIKGNMMLLNRDSTNLKTAELLRAQLNGKPIDFLFIDGDHSYEAVKRDYELYAPLVRKGGIIAFHDTGLRDHPLVDVYKLWEEIVRTENKTFTIHRLDGTGVGILYKE